MTGTNFAQYIRQLTQTNTSTFTDADLVVYANIEKDNLAELLSANVDEGYFNITSTRDLEQGVRNYTYPSDLLKSIRYVAAKLDGTNWEYIRETDFGYVEARNLPLLEESFILNEYASKTPEYLLASTELIILSGNTIQAATDGLKLVLERYPEDITTADLSGTVDLSLPSVETAVRLPRQCHKIWAHMISVAYKSSKDKPLPLSDIEKKIQFDLLDMYNNLRLRNAVRVIQGHVPYDDGQQY